MFRSFYRKKAWMAKVWNIYSTCVIVGVSGPIIFNIPSRVPTEILQHSDTSSRLVPSLDVVHETAAVRRDVDCPYLEVGDCTYTTVNSHRDSGHKSKNALYPSRAYRESAPFVKTFHYVISLESLA